MTRRALAERRAGRDRDAALANQRFRECHAVEAVLRPAHADEQIERAGGNIFPPAPLPEHRHCEITSLAVCRGHNLKAPLPSRNPLLCSDLANTPRSVL